MTKILFWIELISKSTTQNLIFIEVQGLSKKIILKDVLPIFRSDSHIVECSVPNNSNVADFLKANLPGAANNEKNIKKIITKYDIIVDGSDNFKTKFLLNEYSIKYKKILIVGAISKFDGHIFTFNFKNKKTPCLKCFYEADLFLAE